MPEQTTADPVATAPTPFTRGSDLLRLVAIRRPALGRGSRLFVPALVLRLAGAGLLAWIGWVHWVLYHNEGYHFIPTDGPFFLVDAIAGVVLAVVLLAWPRPAVGLAAAGFTAGTILALLISLTVGLFGFTESLTANYVVLALVVEAIAMIVLVAWTILAAWTLPGRPGRVIHDSGWRSRGRRTGD